jgi:hypothetical protein
MTAQEKVEALQVTLNSAGWLNVIRPALNGAINGATQMWLNGSRVKGDEQLTDEGLKQRIVALRWVQGWEVSYAKLVDQLEQVNEHLAQTEPAREGGSPYD